MNRTAYVLTTDIKCERAIYSKKVLENIGFMVQLLNCIPMHDKVLSNKKSMQMIYKTIAEGYDNYAYVFEDDIEIHTPIHLKEIIEYEKITPNFFYLGMCEINSQFVKKTETHIGGYPVHTISGNVRGLHAIGISKEGAHLLLNFSMASNYAYMDMILEDFSRQYPAPIVRYDLESYIRGHKGILFQNRKKFPSLIG
jgi:hypothetical protein